MATQSMLLKPTLRIVASLMVLIGGNASSQPQANEGSVEKSAQQEFIARFTKCPPGVNEAVRHALEHKKELLPPHLQAAGGMPQVSTGTMIDAAKNAPPEDRAKMAIAIKKMGLTMEQYEKMIAANAPKTLGKAAPGFMVKPAARIRFQNEVGKFCNAECELDIAWNVMVGLAFWKNGCHSCSDDFLSVVALGTGIWVDSRIGEWIDSPQVGTSGSFPLTGKTSSFDARTRAHTATVIGARPTEDQNKAAILTYRAVSEPMQVRLCSAKATGTRPRALNLLTQALCEKSRTILDTSDVVHMQVALKAGPTSCGASETFIGCGRPDNSIEMTFEGARYSFLDVRRRGPVSIGPKDAVELSGTDLLTHEIGHWFGLPHLDYEPKNIRIPDVMQAALDEGTCASELSIWLIQNMGDADYQKRFRLTQGEGLRRPAPPSALRKK